MKSESSSKKIQRCTRCIMDNSSDNTIRFNENGVCNYCTEAYIRKEKVYFPGIEGHLKFENLIESLKKRSVSSYDCIIGLSGGLDSIQSAYLANLAAGIVVAKVGTYAVSREELLETLDRSW